MKFVRMLEERGETVLQPTHREPSGHVYGYVKTQHPHKDAGAIFQDRDGMFGLFGDFGALYIVGIAWEDIGLCDSQCWYEWMNPAVGQPTKERFCECCGQKIS